MRRPNRYMRGGFRYRQDGTMVSNMANTMSRKRFLQTAGVGAAGLGAAAYGMSGTVSAVGGDEPWENEIIYLSDCDNRLAERDGTNIYTVHLTKDPNRADLEFVFNTKVEWEKKYPLGDYYDDPTDKGRYDVVAAIAVTPDGKKMYLLDNETAWLAYYDFTTGKLQDIADVGTGGIALLSFSPPQLPDYPNGRLYASSSGTDKLYIIDENTGAISDQGIIKKDGDYQVNVDGADIAFTADGKLLLWANSPFTKRTPPDPITPAGLYELHLPGNGTVVNATYLGGTGKLFTGTAIRDDGAGDMIGSVWYSAPAPNTIYRNSIVEIDKSNGSIIEHYRMYYPDDEEFTHRWGDMSVGHLEKGPCGEVKEYTLWAAGGQDEVAEDVGNVTVWNNETNLHVVYTTTGGWCISETHLFVGDSLENMPQTKNGQPKLGQFPYTMDHDPCTTFYEYIIPLSELGITDFEEECDPTQFVIVPHAVVQLISPGDPDSNGVYHYATSVHV
jgi:hypothetical protein